LNIGSKYSSPSYYLVEDREIQIYFTQAGLLEQGIFVICNLSGFLVILYLVFCLLILA
jgi:hypothetical protein